MISVRLAQAVSSLQIQNYNMLHYNHSIMETVIRALKFFYVT